MIWFKKQRYDWTYYLDAFDGYDEIYCVTITSQLSGSYNAAMTAKQQYEEENQA